MLSLDPKVDHGPQLNVAVWVMVSVATLFLFTRLYLKHCQNRGLWWDDYALLGAWAAQTAQAGLVSYIIGLGYGKLVIPKENIPLFGFPVNLLSTFLICANFLGKLSFGLTLLRIPAVWMRLIVLYIIITLAATLGMSSVLVWVECFEFKRKTDCVAVDVSVKYNMFSCVYSAVMDVALAFLPWKYIWSLQMSKKEKAGVVLAMSMGVFAGAAAGLKTATLPTVATDPLMSISLVIWGNAESAICIMAASIPILRALVRGGMRDAVPFGYETYGTGYTGGMTESGAGSSITTGAGLFGRRPGVSGDRQMTNGQNVRNEDARDQRAIKVLDQTLVSDSPEPLGKPKLSGDEDWSDQDSIELANYQHDRPQTPRDFLRNPV